MSLIVQDVASEQGPEYWDGWDGFVSAPSETKWYENLERYGSCKRLLELLREDPTLIHGLGYKNMTVFHKGVQHGCVVLVRFVLVDMFDDSSHCKCLHCACAPILTREKLLWNAPVLTREKLLRKTCSYGSTAVNMAVVRGSLKMVVLLEWAIKMCKRLSGQSTALPALCNLFWYRNVTAICASYVETKVHEEGTYAESIIDRDDDFLVPDVEDDDVCILMPLNNDEVVCKVIFVIEEVLGDPGHKHRHWMDMVKEWFVKDVDFGFVPLAHVFLHFLYSIDSIEATSDAFGCFQDYFRENNGFKRFQEDVTKRIFDACGGDGEDGESKASDEARKWWFEKVVSEVVALEISVLCCQCNLRGCRIGGDCIFHWAIPTAPWVWRRRWICSH